LKDREKISQIYEALPKLNCGLCGFANCGHFARAVAQGKASPFGCKQNPLSGYKISEIIGMKVPAYHYGLQPVFASRPGGSPSPKVLRKEVRGLSRRVDGVLARIENLKTKRGHEYRYLN
jgi:Na+-translocating ferredoxin:NAD+ oxidoreductase RNF subunit RnfB